jgi:metal-responsive CopG/Arc/MetJ family transcriptional regulator
MAKRVFSISVDESLMTRLDDLADAQGVSRSKLVEKFITDGIGEQEVAVRMWSDPVVMGALGKAFNSPDVLRRLASAIEAETTPDQLQLFQHTLQKLADDMGQAPVKKKKKAGKK